MKQKLPELPFILEGNTAPRSTIRAIAKNADGLHKINLSLIKIRPRFNARRKGENISEELYEQMLMIPQLADGIYASNGPDEPLLGDIFKENNKFYITNGERRFRALRHLMATGRDKYPNGSFVEDVYVLLNPAGTTDLDRKRKVIATQDNLKLKPIERAYYYLSFKEDDGLTHQQIADLLQVSRQTVDNYILATELPADIQDQVDADQIKINVALADFREKRKADKPKKTAEVDLETGEVIDKKDDKENLRGDESEFEQQDNSIPGVSSKGGFKEEGSGAHVIGKDSIYMDQQKLALWKQFVNRYEKVKEDIMLAATFDYKNLLHWEDILAERLKNEYNLTVK